MELNKTIIGTTIIILLILSGVSVQWYFTKDYSTIYRDGEKLASARWVVEAERTSFLLDSWYDTNVKCPKVLENGGHISDSGKSCMYPDNYYEQLSRSLINTKVSDEEFTISRDTPYYIYGTRGSYAGIMNEVFEFVETSTEKEFPKSYITTWTPKDTKQYKAVLRVWDLKDQPLEDGIYNNCVYTAKNMLIDLQDECSKLDRAEVKDDQIYFYFDAERDTQTFDIKIVDPPEQAALVSPANLVAHYTFDGNALDSACSNDGTVTGAILTDDSKNGQAYYFDGDGDYITLGTDDSIRDDLDVASTISAWIKLEGTTTSLMSIVASSDDVSSSGYSFSIYQQDLRMSYADSGNFVLQQTTNNVARNEWVHVVETYNGTHVFLYKNGVLQSATGTIGSGTTSSVNSVTIGARESGGDNYFNGTIDEVRIYNDTLTPTEIKQLYEEFNTPDDYLVSNWKFNGDATDSSGSNDGTNSGATITNDGKHKEAYSFDGDSGFITVSNDDSIKFATEDFSLGAWIKTSGTEYMSIFDKRQTNDVGYRLWVWDNNKIAFSINTIDMYSVSPVNDNKWHYVMVTLDRDSNAQMYIDGLAEGSPVSINSEVITSTADLTIGAGVGDAFVFDGIIDEVRIYKTSLTASQVSELYNSSVKSNKVELYGSPSENDVYDGSNLVAHWKLNGNIYDSSEYRNDGTSSSNIVDIDGQINGAYNFTKSISFVRGPDSDSLDISNNFAIATWVKVYNTAGINDYIFCKYDDAEVDNAYALVYEYVDNMVEFYSGSGKYTGDNPRTGSQIEINDTETGVWHHIVYNYDGSTWSGYKDNVEIFSLEKTFSLLPSTGDFSLGNLGSGTSGFEGAMDDTKIYNKALTRQEITDLYYERPEIDGLISHYKFDKNALDSNSRNNGTITGDVANTTGKFNWGYSFDGSGDYIKLDEPIILDNGTNTVSFWAKSDDVLHQSVIGTGTTPFSYIDMRENTNDIAIETDVDSDDVAVCSGVVLTDNDFHHYTLVREYLTIKCYKDGIYIDEDVFDGGGYDLTISSLGRGYSDFGFNGTLDEIKFFNTNLSQTEVTELYETSYPDETLEMYLKMDGSIEDSSKNNITAVGTSATVTNDGKFNQGYNFDGTQTILLTGAEPLNFKSKTFSTWLKFNELPSETKVLFTRGSNGNYYFSISSDGSPHMSYRDASGTQHTAQSSADITDLEWHHIASVMESNGDDVNVYFYIDGVKGNTISFTGGVQEEVFADGRIGGFGPSWGVYDGSLDEMKLFSKVLTQEEISELYNESETSHKIELYGTPSEVSADLPDDLVANYNFNNNALDSSINRLDGTVNGGVTNTSGHLNGAFDFDGEVDTNVELPDSTELEDFTSKSVFMWIKPNVRTVTADFYSGGYWSAPYGDLMRFTAGQECMIYLRNETGDAVSYGTIDCPANEWNFVGYTWNGTTVIYYKDGVEVGDRDEIKGVMSGAGDVHKIGGGNGWYNGSIDDVRIYSTALTPEEITTLYRLSPPDEALRGYWKLDGNALDTSGNGNDGIVTDATVTNDGKYGQAYEFSSTANDKICMDDAYYEDVTTGNYTFAAWIKPNLIPTLGYRNVISKRYQWGRSLFVSGTQLRAYNNLDSDGSRATSVQYLVQPDIWQFVVSTYDDDNKVTKLYYNGVEPAYSELSAGAGTMSSLSSDDLCIGSAGVDVSFNGEIDEVKVFGSVLSQAEILELYSTSQYSNRFEIYGDPTR